MTLSVDALNTILDEINISYYESGANHDCDYEKYVERSISIIEATYNLSVVEF